MQRQPLGKQWVYQEKKAAELLRRLLDLLAMQLAM
jgi:hypothetical protein